MENIIIGAIGLALGVGIGVIIGKRSAARELERRMRRRIRLGDASIGVEVFEFKIGNKGQIEGMKVPSSFIEKSGALPKDFGKMSDESHPLSRKVPVKSAPKKRVSKPRTPEQRERAKLKMRKYRARKRSGK